MKKILIALCLVALVWGRTTLQSLQGEDLPLKNIIVRSEIVDFIGQVTIEQHYENDQHIPLECIYKFPIDEKAVVTDLIAEIDGRVIKGISKPKETAKREYEEAKAKGKTAFLMDENTSDVVSLKVGNIPPKTAVKITVKYLTELGLEGDYLRFVVPTTIAPRYSTSSPYVRNQDPNAPLASKVPYTIKYISHLKMPSTITHLSSPTHPNSLINLDVETPANERMVSILINDLNSDITLLIGIEKPSEARAWLEEGTLSDTLMVSLYPDFESTFNNLPVPTHTQPQTVTILFDKSGSMTGSNIIEAKRAVSLLVTKLKTKYPSVLFNIVTFSSSYSFMFPRPVSVIENADYALRQINQIDADGGTEMFNPLKSIISQLNPSFSNNVIVLTDGEISFTQELFDWVQKNYQEHFRLFSIGIGLAASQELVNGVARVGKGAAEYAIPGDENLEQKVDRQLSRALFPTISLEEVSWNVPTVEFSSPSRFPLPLYQKSRVLAFASIPHGTFQEIPHLNIQGKIIHLPITKISGSILAKLAAKSRIRELERENNAESKAEIISLATKHNLLSKETSYIAVDCASAVDPQETKTVVIPLQAPSDRVSQEATQQASHGSYHYGAKMAGRAGVAVPFQTNTMVTIQADAAAPQAASAPVMDQFDRVEEESVPVMVRALYDTDQDSNWLRRWMSAGNVPMVSSFLFALMFFLLWIQL